MENGKQKIKNQTILLLGDTKSKRTIYFKKAAKYAGVPIQVLPYYSEKKMEFLSETAELLSAPADPAQKLYCKIDPPSYHFQNREEDYQIDSTYQACRRYHSWLSALPAPSAQLQYLNPPENLVWLLDKYQCKQQLIHAGLSETITPLLGKDIENCRELRQKMKDWHCNSIFIKPRLASGAAGVLAYRWHPATDQEVLYTSACLKSSKNQIQIVNTKKLFCYHDREQIETICHHLLPLGTVIERWVPKSVYNHCSYDLRVLYQFGHIAFITVRLSNGPITNLHLNNRPLVSEQPGTLPECLGITKNQYAVMEKLCHRAVSAFDGLSMAGIDILFEKNSGMPMIIEMNGQGDLLYQDIYHENKIYREQIMALKGGVSYDNRQHPKGY